MPHVFGGWNNGSMSSVERLDYCRLSEEKAPAPGWVEVGDLMVRRKILYYRSTYLNNRVPM